MTGPPIVGIGLPARILDVSTLRTAAAVTIGVHLLGGPRTLLSVGLGALTCVGLPNLF
jgi:hypothetical protein